MIFAARALPTPGQGLQDGGDPHLADHLVGLALLEDVADRGALALEPLAQLGTRLAGGGGLLEGGGTLFRGQVRQGHGRPNRVGRGPCRTRGRFSGLVGEGLASEPRGQPSSRQIRWSRATSARSRVARVVAVHTAVHLRGDIVIAAGQRGCDGPFRNMNPRFAGRETVATRRRTTRRPVSAGYPAAPAPSSRSSTGRRPPAARRRRARRASTSRETVGTTTRAGAEQPAQVRRPNRPARPAPARGPGRPARRGRRPGRAAWRRPRRRRNRSSARTGSRGRGPRRCRATGRPRPSPGCSSRAPCRRRPARPTARPRGVLERAGVGVGRAGQHEQAAAVQPRGVDGRLQRAGAQVGADRHGVDRERVVGPQVVAVGVHRRADVAALGVQQHQGAGGPRPRRRPPPAPPARASRAARRTPTAA